MKLQILGMVVSVILIVLILLQERSAGMSGIFGGDGGAFYQARRGLEKFIFAGTIIFGALFAALSILHLVL